MSKEKIIAVVVDTQLLTLYRTDGSTIVIPQGDPRVRSIIDAVLPIVEKGGVADVDLELPNSYRDFEEKSSGFVRFFRAAKKSVAKIFSDPVGYLPEGAHGPVPLPPKVSEAAKAVDEILTNAQPVSHPDFKESDTTDDHEMVAVVGKGAEARVIPEVSKIKEQFAYAAKGASTKGMENFMLRISTVIDKRQHSVQDLLNFLQHGDLPIADDGSIIAYKRLYSDSGRYVDPHTRKVSQTVGSYVCLDEGMVDLSRRNECSNGLHIGRRAYMGRFSGDVMMMCKIDPEDVMVVPHGDPNKVRVKGYHIVAKLNQKAFSYICNRQPATQDPETARLLTQVMKGDHISRIEEVRIGGEKGTNVKITKFEEGQAPAIRGKAEHSALDDLNNSPAKVDPKQIDQQVAEATARKTPSRVEKARRLWDHMQASTSNAMKQHAALTLLDFKKAAKVGWDALGIDEAMVATITANAAQKAPTAKPGPISAPSQAAAVDKIMSAGAKQTAQSGRNEKIRQAQAVLNSEQAVSSTDRISAARELLAIRKAAKKSWESMGFGDVSDEMLKTVINTTLPAPVTEIAKPAATPKPAKAEPKAKPEAKVKKTVVAENPSIKPRERARQLFNAKDWINLLAFKKTKKKAWDMLGFTNKEIQEIKLYVGESKRDRS